MRHIGAQSFTDPDLRNPYAKPNYAHPFRRDLGVAFYIGCGSGPYCTKPYHDTGVIPPLVHNGNSVLTTSKMGWCQKGAAAQSADRWGCDGTSLTWFPPQTQGLFMTAITAKRDSNTAPGSNRRTMFHYGDSTLSSTHFSVRTTLAGSLLAGWSSGGTTGQCQIDLAPSGTPLWVSGDFVVIQVIYTANGQTLTLTTPYKGRGPIAVATGTGTPNVFSGADNRLAIGGGEGNNRGTDEPNYYAMFARSALSFQARARAAWAPMNFMFDADLRAA